MKPPPVNRLKAALMGAVVTLAIAAFRHLSGELPARGEITYCFGAAIGGALMGVLVAWLIDLRRPRV